MNRDWFRGNKYRSVYMSGAYDNVPLPDVLDPDRNLVVVEEERNGTCRVVIHFKMEESASFCKDATECPWFTDGL